MLDRPEPDRSDGATSSRGDIDVWLFDLDNTLYPPSSRLFDQVNGRISAFVQDYLSLDPEAAHRLQRRYFHEFGTTMRGLMTNHGLEPEGYLEYVHDIDLSPIAAAPGLDAALGRLPGRKIIFTNASTPYAERVLDAWASSGTSKPSSTSRPPATTASPSPAPTRP